MNEMLAPVLHDLRSTCPVAPEIRDAEDGVWLFAPGGGGQLIPTQLREEPEVDRIARLADQVQEWAVEALWSAQHPAVWPECPTHPNAHPLKASVTEERPVWSCPESGTVIAEIGAL